LANRPAPPGTLADAIKRDILRDRPAAPASPTCFLCNRTFSQGKGHGINGPFCSVLCLNAYDDGFMPGEAVSPYKFPIRGDGFLTACKGCNREFISRGPAMLQR